MAGEQFLHADKIGARLQNRIYQYIPPKLPGVRAVVLIGLTGVQRHDFSNWVCSGMRAVYLAQAPRR